MKYHLLHFPGHFPFLLFFLYSQSPKFPFRTISPRLKNFIRISFRKAGLPGTVSQPRTSSFSLHPWTMCFLGVEFWVYILLIHTILGSPTGNLQTSGLLFPYV